MSAFCFDFGLSDRKSYRLKLLTLTTAANASNGSPGARNLQCAFKRSSFTLELSEREGTRQSRSQTYIGRDYIGRDHVYERKFLWIWSLVPTLFWDTYWNTWTFSYHFRDVFKCFLFCFLYLHHRITGEVFKQPTHLDHRNLKSSRKKRSVEFDDIQN